MKPIKPEELGEAAINIFPAEVFEIVNEAIVSKWNGSSAMIKQEELITRMCNQMNLTRSAVFDLGYLNFEEAYRAQGWKVLYDKPAYNESYDAFFKFTRK